ncbi:hypothetical protein TNCV_3593281 [Trichonephila clavipes]|nr:hypothetical protein TNCV_3593281 [Trichonephila clavipes]
MITNFFIHELNNHDVQELWFQQDGASLVYADKPQTLDHLEDNIRRVIAYIRPQMLEKVIENWTSRLDYIRASRGSPMPEIIFKMIFTLSSAANCNAWSSVSDSLMYATASEFVSPHSVPSLRLRSLEQEKLFWQENRILAHLTHVWRYLERDRQLENAFNQIHAFEVLNQEVQQENFEEELEMIEQYMTDDEFLNAKRAMNVGQKDAFLCIRRNISEQINN